MSFSLMMKGEIQFVNISPERIYKSFCDNTSDNKLFKDPPYPLALEINELILPPENSRKAIRFKKNPYSKPPRPQNAWIIFRRNYTALSKSKGVKMSNADISRSAAEEWRKQPKEVVQFFEILEILAKEMHNEIYPGFKFRPERNKESKSKKATRDKPEIIEFKISKSHNEVASEEVSSNINCADNILNNNNFLFSDSPNFLFNEFNFFTEFSNFDLGTSFFQEIYNQQTFDQQISGQEDINFSDYLVDLDSPTT
ncbi:8371_t:CDS:1 [Cetraspora pellucida]|uniref:8371_t:CDS:1 n=1 Tax=Cetraspora pellucida TaxID=1433469 RepID=A0A9N9FFA6_9GLOM|nr:8371_t:CDS:1 [Cetraspora pellucida]